MFGHFTTLCMKRLSSVALKPNFNYANTISDKRPVLLQLVNSRYYPALLSPAGVSIYNKKYKKAAIFGNFQYVTKNTLQNTKKFT